MLCFFASSSAFGVLEEEHKESEVFDHSSKVPLNLVDIVNEPGGCSAPAYYDGIQF